MASNKRCYSSPIAANDDKKFKMAVSLVCTEILQKNGEPLLSSSFNVIDALAMWEQVFKLNQDVVFGVALIKTKDRGIGVNFKLKKDVPLDLEKTAKFDFVIGGDSYSGRLFTERGPPPALGEPVVVKASGFGFHLTAEQISDWLRLFGHIDGEGEFKDHELAPVKTDVVTFSMRLRKHIPSVLPAYGRKLQIFYHGQPKLCGACFERNHVRKDCTNPRVDWMKYVKFINKELAPLSMLGRWGDYLVKDPAYNANGMSTPARKD